MEVALDSKYCFVTNDIKSVQIFRSVQPGCRALLPWLNSLRNLFDQGHVSWKQHRYSPGCDLNTHDGHITFHNFMAALGGISR